MSSQSQQQLQQQNLHLQKIINQYIQQIDNLKKINEQHQKEIENLLKFNQRLLTIIEEEVNNNPNKNIQRSLQPISQVTQVDSQTMQQLMQSLQKTKTKLAARSQRGAPYRSQIDIKHDNYNINDNNNINNTQSLNNFNTHNNYMNTLNHYLAQSKDLQRSQRYVPTIQKQQSQFGNKSSFSKKRQKKTNNYINSSNNMMMPDKQKLQFGSRQQLIDHQLSIEQLQRASTDARPLAVMNQFIQLIDENDNKQNKLIIKNSTNNNTKQYSLIQQQITQKMNWQIQQMRKNSQMNHQFLDQKITQLNKLSKQITYNPQQKFNELQNKIKLPPHLAAMVKKAMVTKCK